MSEFGEPWQERWLRGEHPVEERAPGWLSRWPQVGAVTDETPSAFAEGGQLPDPEPWSDRLPPPLYRPGGYIPEGWQPLGRDERRNGACSRETRPRRWSWACRLWYALHRPWFNQIRYRNRPDPGWIDATQPDPLEGENNDG